MKVDVEIVGHDATLMDEALGSLKLVVDCVVTRTPETATEKILSKFKKPVSKHTMEIPACNVLQRYELNNAQMLVRGGRSKRYLSIYYPFMDTPFRVAFKEYYEKHLPELTIPKWRLRV